MTMLLSRADVLSIPAEHCPMVVLTDNLFSFFALGIRRHCQGAYNHAMLMIEPGRFVSQGLFYRSIPPDYYLKNCHIKFWKNPNWHEWQRVKVRELAEERLAESWYRRLYDFPGVVGQALGIRWFQSPWRNYCSEDVARVLKAVEPGYLSRWARPDEINAWLKGRAVWECYGKYDPDE